MPIHPSLSAHLEAVFERMAEEHADEGDGPSRPTLQPFPTDVRSNRDEVLRRGAGPSALIPRGNVEVHQPFRIRRTLNGHRLPPLPSHSFEAKLERTRQQQAATAQSMDVRKNQNSEQIPRHHTARDLPPVAVQKKHPKNSAPQPRTSDHRSGHSVPTQSGCTSSDDVHRRHCGLCAESFHNDMIKAMERIRNLECQDRQRLELSWMSEREGRLTDAWVALRHAKEAEHQAQEEERAAGEMWKRHTQILDELATQDHREGRRAIMMDWDVGFDEIAALERISVRHMTQVREVNERRLLRSTIERDQTVAAAEKRDEERRLQRVQMARDSVAGDEGFDRDHITREEAAVFTAYGQVFREARRKVSEAETYVNNMLARHAARLQNIDNEKDKLRVEEAIRREQNVAAEKRSFEMILLMEPESRRKETIKETTRLRKEAAERMVIEDAMFDARAVTSSLEIEEREAHHVKEEKDYQRVVYWESRRMLREQRSRMRQQCEVRNCASMQVEDDLAFVGVQQTFIRSLQYPCMDEEAATRLALAAQKKAEKDYIWGLLRARLFLSQEERRLRVIVDEDQKRGLEELEEHLRRSKTVATFLWFEQVERRAIVSEYEAICGSALSVYQAHLHKAAEVTCKCPQVRNDKTTMPPTMSSSSGGLSSLSEFGVWVRYSIMTWYWLSEDVVLLDGCTARASPSAGSSILAEFSEPTDVTVELLNGDEGDEITYQEPNNPNDPLPITSRKDSALTIVYPTHCPTRDLFSAFRYRNTEAFAKTKLFPRVVRVSMGAALRFHVWVIPAPPVCPMPEQCITARTVFPLTNLSVPNFADFKTCRLVLALDASNTGSLNGGHRLALLFPNEFTMHQKNGLMYQGKVLMRPKNITDRVVEIEFEVKPAPQLKTFLQYIAVQHGDDTSVLAPLRLDVFLTRKSDGSVLRIAQAIDIDHADTVIPRLRIPGPELFFRLRSSPIGAPAEVEALAPANPQHVFSTCCLVFPKDQPDVQGGVFRVALTGHDGTTNIGLHCSTSGPQLVVDRTKTQLFCLLDEATLSSTQPSQAWLSPTLSRRISSKKVLPQGGSSSSSCHLSGSSSPAGGSGLYASQDAEALRRMGFVSVADIVGLDSTQLIIQLRSGVGSVPLPHSVIHQLIQSITIMSTRTELPPKKSELSMTLTLTADIGLKSDPIHATFKLTLLPSVLECTARNGAFPYREGAGPKTLPSLSMRPRSTTAGPLLSPDAMLMVRIVSGLEPSDVLNVLDCEERDDGCLVHVQNNQPIAEVRRLGNASLEIMLAGQFCGAEWLRESSDNCYSLASSSQIVASKFDVTLQHVNVLLRSITYNCTSVNPKEERKAVLVTLDDGRSGRSSVVLDLTVESVDDPTDIIIDDPVVEFRQFSKKANLGCPILATVRLEDIDSDNFHGGYIVVEHSSGPAEVGDHLYILSPKQQELLLYRARGASSVSRLQHLLASVSDAATCMALAVVVDEQPQPILTLRDNRYLVYYGDTIGQMSIKQAGSKDEKTTYWIKFSFSSDSKFISFPTAEYCLRCFGFDNRSAKMNTTQRQYQITLNCTGLKSTADTVERVTVDGYVALLSNPAFANSVRFEEGGKPKHLLKQASTALQQPQLYQRGYVRAIITNAFDGDEIQIDPASTDFKVKDGRTVLCAKENVATIATRKTQNMIHIDFVKVTNQTLQNLVRSLVYNTVTRMMDPTQRIVEIECSTGEEVDLCSVSIAVDITRRDEPVEFLVAPDAPQPFLHMSGQPAMRLCMPYVNVNFRKPMPPSSEIEVQLSEKPKLGEHLTFAGTEDVDLIEDNDGQKVFFWVNGKSVAFTQKPKNEQEEDGTFLCAGKVLTVQITTEMNPVDMKRILDTLGYVNTSKGDRGARKMLSLGFKQRGTTIAKFVLPIEILNPMLDFSLCPPVVNSAGSTTVAPACRLQLSSSLRQLEIAVVMVTGYDYSDSLSFKFPANNPFGFQLSGEGTAPLSDGSGSEGSCAGTSSLILITTPTVVQSMQQQQQQQQVPPPIASGDGPLSPSMRGKRASVSFLKSAGGAVTDKGNFVLASTLIQPTSIVVAACGSPLSNSALQAVLRSVCLTGESRGDKDILLEITVSSPSCGQCRELVRVLM